MTGNFASLLLTPDFCYHGDVLLLKHVLNSLSADVIAAVPLEISPPDVTEMYEGRVSHKDRVRNSDNIWLSRRLYGLGVSLYLLLRGNVRDGVDPLLERVRQIKGSSIRSEAAAGTLRSMSSLVDRCFSLVHSPDDEEGMRHDLQIALGSGLEAYAFSGSAEPVPTWEYLLPARPAISRNPLSIIPDLIARVAILIAGDIWGERERAKLAAKLALASLDHIEAEAISKIEVVISGVRTAVDLIGELGGRNPKCHYVRPQCSPEMRNLLCRLTFEIFSSIAFTPSRAMDLIGVFACNAIPLSSWETQRLLCLSNFK